MWISVLNDVRQTYNTDHLLWCTTTILPRIDGARPFYRNLKTLRLTYHAELKPPAVLNPQLWRACVRTLLHDTPVPTRYRRSVGAEALRYFYNMDKFHLSMSDLSEEDWCWFLRVSTLSLSTSFYPFLIMPFYSGVGVGVEPTCQIIIFV